MLGLLLMSLHLDDQVTIVDRLPSAPANTQYVGNRAPLAPSPFAKLPVGAVKPDGWLRTQLELQRDGFSGQLDEISQFLDDSNNAWLTGESAGRAGWEELPYWLKGQISLGYLLDDKEIIAQSKKWVEGALKSSREDGWFGPESNLVTRHGTPDLWPNMIMQNVLQTYYEATGDKRVLDVMTKYAHWLLKLPDEQMLDPDHYWHYHREGDQLASVVWLYGHTGDPELLKLADRLHANGAPWVAGVQNVHGVNFAQAFREPATYSLFSGNRGDVAATEQNLKEFTDKWGQMPGGMYGADENAREGFTDPRQAAETCAVVEMMLSHEMLLRMTGDPTWADRAEDVAFNWMPPTMTPDLKGLRYLFGANMAVSDARNHNPGIQNGGPMFLMDPNDHRCCQHNVSHGWPYFAEHLWMATAGDGLAAVIYSPSTVTAKVAGGKTVTIKEETDYPFSESITFRIMEGGGKFPLSLRMPGWARAAFIEINGETIDDIEPQAGQFIRIDRDWKKGDVVVMRMPMRVQTIGWSQRPNTTSVYYGPLAYSLKIGEKYVRHGGTDEWPAYEIHPTTDWNYGLVENPRFEIHTKEITPGEQPWTPDNVPVWLTTRARKIPNWKLDYNGLVSPLQASPAKTDEEIEEVQLIPMGAARLRITVFPTVTTGARGHEWEPPMQPADPLPTRVSHCYSGDTPNALSDQLIPTSSNDHLVPRLTWWNHKGTEEWVEYYFDQPRSFSRVEVYWFDDSASGGCNLPASWKAQVWKDGAWQDVETRQPYGTEADKFNVTEFKPETTTRIRIVVQLQEDWSGGILEWRAS